MARLTKKQLIDYIVYQATRGRFFGDRRDGRAPPITLQNFTQEMFRCGAKALRARLSGLSYRQVLQEGMAAIEDVQRCELLRFRTRYGPHANKGCEQIFSSLRQQWTQNATFQSRLTTP